MSESDKVSIVIPAKNEAHNLAEFLPRLVAIMPDAEIILVDDGSTDNTAELVSGFDLTHIRHPYSKGNGAAIKSGARAANGDVLVFLDGDGQHRPEDIPAMIAELDKGYDMVVGARGRESQASASRAFANGIYNWLSSLITEQQVKDLTSGFRVVKASLFREFLYLLPNGFSYPTTCTMAFFRAGYSVAYYPIKTETREGESHINLIKDGIRFFLIIFKVGTLYSPLKIFLPVAVLYFITGSGYYLYTYLTMGRFTNMSAVLFMTAIIIFLIGLVSEQITALMYKDSSGDH